MEPFLYDEFYAIERTHWWSVGMRAVFHMLLNAALHDVPAPRLLDVGCGTGIGVEEFGRYGAIFGCDAAWSAVIYTKQRNPTRGVCQADLLHLPFAADSLDAVLAFDVIEHLDNESVAIREIHRVLRPKGIAVINVPAFPSLWSEKDIANHHCRRYTRRMLRAQLQGAAFDIERITYTNATLFPIVWSVRQVQRLMRRPWNSNGEYRPHLWLNDVLTRLLRLEQRALRYLSFPFGTSVTCLARKPTLG